MEKQFVTYKLSLKLKELGFKEECFKVYDTLGYLQNVGTMVEMGLPYILAPLWQQAFDWFFKELNYFSEIFMEDDGSFGFLISSKVLQGRLDQPIIRNFMSTKEAREACLTKLIEICEKN